MYDDFSDIFVRTRNVYTVYERLNRRKFSPVTLKHTNAPKTYSKNPY